jgi:hypothetical protein
MLEQVKPSQQSPAELHAKPFMPQHTIVSGEYLAVRQPMFVSVPQQSRTFWHASPSAWPLHRFSLHFLGFLASLPMVETRVPAVAIAAPPRTRRSALRRVSLFVRPIAMA